jgi:hypothetical protein
MLDENPAVLDSDDPSPDVVLYIKKLQEDRPFPPLSF